MVEPNNTWTPARISMLQELWGSGLSAKEIAGKLGAGISRNAVIGKAHRLGLSSRPSPIKRVEKAAGAPGIIKTRSSAPKAMGLRRDTLIGSGNFAGRNAALREEESAPRATASFQPPRNFKAPATAAAAQQCRWPLGDPLKAGFHFCESHSIPGLPYCYDHACLAYQGSKKKSPSAPREAEAADSAESVSFGAVNNS